MVQYGQIDIFVADPRPVLLIKICHIGGVSMMQSAGNPYKPKLLLHKEVDFLSTIIKPVIFSSTLIAVSVDDIISKPVTVKVDGRTYLIDQPNVYEHH